MRMFRLSAQVTVGAYTEVMADNLEEAIRIGSSRSVEIGGPGTGVYPAESWVIDEADGVPTNITEA